MADDRIDQTTQSNYVQIYSTDVAFDWTVDFDTQTISGSAQHTLKIAEDAKDVKHVIFDTIGLEISAAQVNGKNTTFELQKPHPVMGSALHIDLPSTAQARDKVIVTIVYKTGPDCTALQWLEKEQTQGKTFPFLFSQCQPIYARAIAPLQDSPSVKIKYTASVSCVFPVLMSAIRVSPPSDGPVHNGKQIGKDSVTYTYDQPLPIPSYLLAIAAGNVVYRALPGPKEARPWSCGIWAEPELIDASYWEFSEDTSRFLVAEEKIVGDYRFGVYDMIVLPPAFPYGGMENACLTFLTPTLLAGDRSLVDVVVHELTHSWFGNGITHAHASHFWLNEGWTSYMERVLQEVLHGPEERGFSFVIGRKALDDALEEYSDRPKYQRLVIEFEKGEDPDDAYSSVPYEKGANLILHLERTLGGLDVLLPYVRDYVNTYIEKSITTQQWKDHLYSYFQKHNPEKVKLLDTIDWNAWFFGEGLTLPVQIEYDMTLAASAHRLAAKWDASRSTADPSTLDFSKADIKDFSSNQIIVFLEKLQSYPALPTAHVLLLGSLYSVDTTTNTEIRLRFYEVAYVDPSSEVAKLFAEPGVNWAVGADETGFIKGRMKFCRPIFRSVGKIDRDLAVKAFSANKQGFHPIARKLIEKDLGLVETGNTK